MRRLFVPSLVLLSAACGAATVTSPEEAPTEQEARYAIALRFQEASPSAGGDPRTRVSLVRISPEGERTVRELGTEAGACYLDPAPGALLSARCWWGEASARYVLERRGEAILALRGDESGAELREVLRLEVPEDAALDVLGGGSTEAVSPRD